MRSDQGGEAQGTLTPPPAPITPASSQQEFLKHIESEEALLLKKTTTGHAMRFVSVGAKKGQVDETCWRSWITQRRKW